MFPRRRVSAECQRVLCGNSTFSQPQLASRGCWQLRYHKLHFNTCLSKNSTSLHWYRLSVTGNRCLDWSRTWHFFLCSRLLLKVVFILRASFSELCWYKDRLQFPNNLDTWFCRVVLTPDQFDLDKHHGTFFFGSCRSVGERPFASLSHI